jgi:hypothetical protein
VVDAGAVARAAGAIAAAAQGSNAVAVEHAAAAAWQGIIGRVEAAVGNLTALVEAAAAAGDGIDAVTVAADVADAGTSLLSLPSGPVMFLGLAPSTIGAAQPSSWWPGQQVWRVTEAVSLVVAVAGYGYCRADAERRRVKPVPVRSGIVSTRRPGDGL